MECGIPCWVQRKKTVVAKLGDIKQVDRFYQELPVGVKLFHLSLTTLSYGKVFFKAIYVCMLCRCKCCKMSMNLTETVHGYWSQVG